MPKEGSKIIFARNFLPYLKTDKREEFLEKIKSKTDDNSFLVIGAFYNNFFIGEFLHKHGFINVGFLDNRLMFCMNVYKKADKKVKRIKRGYCQMPKAKF